MLVELPLPFVALPHPFSLSYYNTSLRSYRIPIELPQPSVELYHINSVELSRFSIRMSYYSTVLFVFSHSVENAQGFPKMQLQYRSQNHRQLNRGHIILHTRISVQVGIGTYITGKILLRMLQYCLRYV
jgi:hypothetical protein